MPLPLTLYVDPRSTRLVCNPESDFTCIVYCFYFLYFITETADKESWEGCHGTEILYIYIYIYSAIFNCLGVYCIVRSGTGPWARVGLRSFRLLRGPTVSRAFGEFE